jgi:superfamily I DNA/RNA helicase
MDADWWYTHLRASEKPKASFAMQVLRRQGPAALAAQPRVVVGSVHSVKGGECSTCILAPDLSPQGYWTGWYPGGEGRDAIVRMFYVALTRAREKVILLAPSGAEHCHGELREAIAVGESLAVAA